jgi:hypothetical protein
MHYRRSQRQSWNRLMVSYLEEAGSHVKVDWDTIGHLYNEGWDAGDAAKWMIETGKVHDTMAEWDAAWEAGGGNYIPRMDS